MKLISIVAALIITATAVTVAGGAEEKTEPPARHLLWEARSDSGVVYLFGSIHMAKPEFYPLPEVVEGSFEKSEILALEADPETADRALQQKMFSAAMYPAGDAIRRHLSKENYELAVREMARIGLPEETFTRMKPWFLGLTIAIVEFQRLGYAPEYGIDRYFAEKARGKKRIVELESFQYQLDLLSGFSEREQELFLLYSILDLRTAERDINLLMDSWRTGDAKAVERLLSRTVEESPDLLPVYEKLYYRRNSAMTAKIEEYLKSKKKYFVVVGAAHLVGRQGIVELLKEKGYRVRQL